MLDNRPSHLELGIIICVSICSLSSTYLHTASFDLSVLLRSVLGQSIDLYPADIENCYVFEHKNILNFSSFCLQLNGTFVNSVMKVALKRLNG